MVLRTLVKDQYDGWKWCWGCAGYSVQYCTVLGMFSVTVAYVDTFPPTIERGNLPLTLVSRERTRIGATFLAEPHPKPTCPWIKRRKSKSRDQRKLYSTVQYSVFRSTANLRGKWMRPETFAHIPTKCIRNRNKSSVPSRYNLCLQLFIITSMHFDSLLFYFYNWHLSSCSRIYEYL